MARRLSFADIIRKAIRADGRSLYRLAIDSGVNVAVLQRFTSGERGINLATADKICRAVGLKLHSDVKPKG